jgi:pyruvate/2-oxoacid:ferredoxin oxidoreductase alpha subunit
MRVCIDGNEAASRVAHRLSEVAALSLIPPASPMGEPADAWSAEGRPNLREASNPFYAEVPRIVAESFARLAERTGRTDPLVDSIGSPDPERVLVLMGSGAGAAHEGVGRLSAAGERVGVAVPRLFRPFPVAAFTDALPRTTRIAVLDRTKQPGSASRGVDSAAGVDSAWTEAVGGTQCLPSL